MRVRRTIHIFLLFFGVTLISCFAYGGYLMHLQRSSLETPASLALPAQTVDQLLRNAAADLDRKRIEQALIGYRKALTLSPDSVDAQLGVAKAELSAGRESVAAQEYGRVLRLDPRNLTAL